jgi:DNA-binding transcriptional ArsR family regulator
MMKRSSKNNGSDRRVEDGICEVDCVHIDNVKKARAIQHSEKHLRRSADAFKVLAHPSRLRVLKALDGRELCVCDLSQVLGLSMSGTSQQLKKLRDLGAIDYRVDGKLVYYSLADRFWLELAETVLKQIE